jgi:hypothetical protein
LLVCLECNHQKHYLSKKQIINMYKYLVGIWQFSSLVRVRVPTTKLEQL